MTSQRADESAARRRPYSVRVRILAVILAVTALGLLAAGVIAFVLQQNRILTAIDDELHQEFATVEALIEGTSPDDTQDGSADHEAAQTDSAFETTEDLVYEAVRVVTPPVGGGTVGIIDGDARFVPGVSTSQMFDSAAFVEEVVTATASGQTVLDTTSLDGREVRYLAMPLQVESSDETGIFVSAIDVPERLVDLRSTMTVYAWVAAVATVVVALVGWFVAGRLLQPVRHLQRTATRISAGALDERIPVTGNDDLSELTETINAMIARLEAAFVGQRRIVNDVRHELATPVTIIRGHIETIDSHDPRDVQENLEVVVDELDRMSELIAQIAHLADAERATAHRPRWIELGELTRAVFEKARMLGDHQWQHAGAATGMVFVDPSQVTQAWLQLADNSAKYSPAGTPIAIGSSLNADELRCWVSDEGPGIPESARSRIFERFGRADASRGPAGSGLGLPIVQTLVTVHGGRVDLQTETGRGSTFTMVIPRDGSSPHSATHQKTHSDQHPDTHEERSEG